jgi:hypothetical protein
MDVLFIVDPLSCRKTREKETQKITKESIFYRKHYESKVDTYYPEEI